MSAKHTPGPWRVVRDKDSGSLVPKLSLWITSGQWSQFAMVAKTNADDMEGEANARLIAAAPAMAEALRFYADVSKYHAPLTGGMGDLWSDCGDKARAALAAAGIAP